MLPKLLLVKLNKKYVQLLSIEFVIQFVSLLLKYLLDARNQENKDFQYQPASTGHKELNDNMLAFSTHN